MVEESRVHEAVPDIFRRGWDDKPVTAISDFLGLSRGLCSGSFLLPESMKPVFSLPSQVIL